MSSSLPKISIVTPSFFQGEFLEETICSLLDQNYPNLEYMILDGGSTDRSVSIIKKYAKHLTYWRSEKDAGQYAAVEEGLNRSSGEIMGWLNADDKHHPFSLFKLAYFFSTYQDVKWVTGRHSYWGPGGEFLGAARQLVSWSRYDLLQGIQPATGCVQQESTFWQRALWEQSGCRLEKRLSLAADYELWVRFSRYATLHTADTVLAGFRRHPKQKTATGQHRYLHEVNALIRHEVQQQGKPEQLPHPPSLQLDNADFTALVEQHLGMGIDLTPALLSLTEAGAQA